MILYAVNVADVCDADVRPPPCSSHAFLSKGVRAHPSVSAGNIVRKVQNYAASVAALATACKYRYAYKMAIYKFVAAFDCFKLHVATKVTR